MRCPDCSKFVPYSDEPEVEIESEEANDDNEYTVEVHVTLTCGECGTELAETYLDTTESIDHDCQSIPEDGEPEYEVYDSTATPFGGLRHGRPERGQESKKLVPVYGADIESELICVYCKERVSVKVHLDDTTGVFEPMN